MAIPKPAVFGGIAVALLLLTTRKAKATTTSSTTKPTDQTKPSQEDDEDKKDEKPKTEEPGGEEEEPLPTPPKDENKLPDVEPDEEEPQLPKSEDADIYEDGESQFKLEFEKYYKAWAQTGKEQPADPSVDKLWISHSCNSWGIGKNWLPWLPAKYVYSDLDLQTKNLDPDKFLLPTDYITLSKVLINPDPVYVYSLEDLIFYQWTKNIINLYSNCGASIPNRKNYTTFKAYEDALKNFVNGSPIGKLFHYLSETIRGAMGVYWSELHPDLAVQEDLKAWALWSVRTFPKYSYVEQTDQAYKKAFEGDPNAPKKINPKLASHQPYQKAWTNLSQYVKMYRELIKKYG